MLAQYRSNICWVQMSAVCSPDICLQTLTTKYICQAVSTRPCVCSLNVDNARSSQVCSREGDKRKLKWVPVLFISFVHTHIEGDKQNWYWPVLSLSTKTVFFLSAQLCRHTPGLFLPNFVTASRLSLSFSSPSPPSHCHDISRHTIVTSVPFSIQPLLPVNFFFPCAKHHFHRCWLRWSDLAIKTSKLILGERSEAANWLVCTWL